MLVKSYQINLVELVGGELHGLGKGRRDFAGYCRNEGIFRQTYRRQFINTELSERHVLVKNPYSRQTNRSLFTLLSVYKENI